jgi:hypothetical protein
VAHVLGSAGLHCWHRVHCQMPRLLLRSSSRSSLLPLTDTHTHVGPCCTTPSRHSSCSTSRSRSGHAHAQTPARRVAAVVLAQERCGGGLLQTRRAPHLQLYELWAVQPMGVEHGGEIDIRVSASVEIAQSVLCERFDPLGTGAVVHAAGLLRC